MPVVVPGDSALVPRGDDADASRMLHSSIVSFLGHPTEVMSFDLVRNAPFTVGLEYVGPNVPKSSVESRDQKPVCCTKQQEGLKATYGRGAGSQSAGAAASVVHRLQDQIVLTSQRC
jgi:hypothetical protein